MQTRHRGKQSLIFPNRPVIGAAASVAGKKEGEGPLRSRFDRAFRDNLLGQKSWEQAESRLQSIAMDMALKKAALAAKELALVFSGDLLNQCVGSSFALCGKGIPSLGLYGACSTMAEALLLSAACVDAGFAENAMALSSSHFAAAERQYRFPLGYGGQRTPTSQWTVTGAGAALLQATGGGPSVTCATIGSVTERGIKDANNMGAAMAPAAFQTILAHFDDLGRGPEDYDRIVTGDLGYLGRSILAELLEREGIHLGEKLEDCGELIFDRKAQDVHCGGSGCGCSAVVLCGHFMNELQSGRIKRLLLCGTGALLSPVSTQQGAVIPAICHAVCIEANGGA